METSMIQSHNSSQRNPSPVYSTVTSNSAPLDKTARPVPQYPQTFSLCAAEVNPDKASTSLSKYVPACVFIYIIYTHLHIYVCKLEHTDEELL